MKAYSLVVVTIYICWIYRYTSVEIKQECKEEKYFKIGYGANYKYEEMLAHSFNRFYV